MSNPSNPSNLTDADLGALGRGLFGAAADMAAELRALGAVPAPVSARAHTVNVAPDPIIVDDVEQAPEWRIERYLDTSFRAVYWEMCDVPAVIGTRRMFRPTGFSRGFDTADEAAAWLTRFVRTADRAPLAN